MRKHNHITCGTVVVSQEPGFPVALIHVQRQTGVFWGLPKGHVEEGETLAHAAIRETAEETGLAFENLRIVSYLGNIHYEFVTHEEEKTLNDKEVHFFLVIVNCPRADLSPRIDEGILEAKWFALNEAMKMVSYENYRKVLAIAARALSGH